MTAFTHKTSPISPTQDPELNHFCRMPAVTGVTCPGPARRQTSWWQSAFIQPLSPMSLWTYKGQSSLFNSLFKGFTKPSNVDSAWIYLSIHILSPRHRNLNLHGWSFTVLDAEDSVGVTPVLRRHFLKMVRRSFLSEFPSNSLSVASGWDLFFPFPSIFVFPLIL